MADPRSPRRRMPFLLGFAAILAALPAGYFAFLHQPPTPLPPAPAPRAMEGGGLQAPRALEMTLREVQGSVQVRRGSGDWSPAQVGSTLRPSDSVRTQDGAYAVLRDADAVEVRMHPGTEVSVETLTDSLSRVLLGNGMATASVRSGARRTFEVRAAGSEALARTSEGTFTISNNGQGTVAVGAREGEVTLFGQGQPVILRAGQQSIIQPGRAPSEPAPIPSSLLLKVNWPRSTLSRRKLLVTGQTAPGSRVEVGGATVRTDSEGRFSREVVLTEGRNAVEVEALSVGELRQREQHLIEVDTTPPDVGLDPELWKD